MAKEAKLERRKSDEEDVFLVECVVEGHRNAFESLVRKHERAVYRVTLAVLGNEQDAEEAMQDAFVRAYRHIDKFRQESSFKTWLTRIAINEALDKRKAKKNLVSLDEITDEQVACVPQNFDRWKEDPEKLYRRLEVRQIVETAVESLPTIYREALVLRDLEGFNAQEAAEALGITVSALKSRLLRARLLFREELAAKFGQPRSLTTKIVDTTVLVRNAVAMRVMRAIGM